MLEFIGFIALCFVGYKIFKVFSDKNKMFNNIKYAVEIKDFAINELRVPESYFHYLTQNKIEDIKQCALFFKKNKYPDSSWSCLMAITIYMNFYEDLIKNNNLINNLNIDVDTIKKHLEIDPNILIEYFINAKKDYKNYKKHEVDELIVNSSKLANKYISHHPSLEKILEKYAKDNNYFTDYFDGGMGFFAENIDSNNTYTIFINPLTQPYVEGKTPFSFNVNSLPK